MSKYKMNKTKEKIVSQLSENTGRAMCDSGDFYGRNYEKYIRGVNFDVDMDMENLTIPIQLYMINNLEYNKECKKIENYLHKQLEEDDYGKLSIYHTNTKLTLPENYEYLDNVFNTYNYDNDLSQVLQGIFIRSENDNDFVLLCTHNGCDVMGGYSYGVIYQLKDGYDYFILRQFLESEYKDKQFESSYGIFENSYWDEDDKKRYWNNDILTDNDKDKKIEVVICNY